LLINFGLVFRQSISPFLSHMSKLDLTDEEQTATIDRRARQVDLSDEEQRAVPAAAAPVIEDDQFPFSPRGPSRLNQRWRSGTHSEGFCV
jgi:hypothetical protein